MTDVLYLSHCVPGPPDKGERIRAHHVLSLLARRGYRVHVCCFARTAEEQRGARSIAGHASLFVERRSTLRGLWASALPFARGRSLTMAFHRSRRLERAVQALTARVDLRAAVVHSAAMAAYVPAGLPCVLDAVDVDSETWRAFGDRSWPAWLYRREARLLGAAERRHATRAFASALVTDHEARLMAAIAPAARVVRIGNGVDGRLFRPPDGPRPRSHALVLTGTMDYLPNRDAAEWFAREVFPALRRRDPRATLRIVGRAPPRAVRRLARAPGVEVTGPVADVRPYLAGARAVVAPLRIARGVPNKVLEALAMDRPVLASPGVCALFGPDRPLGLVSCASPAEYVDASLGIEDRFAPGAIRAGALARFDWERELGRLADLLGEAIGSAA